MRHFDGDQIIQSESFFRRNLINCLSGYKSLNLVETQTLQANQTIFLIGSIERVLWENGWLD